MEFNTKFKQEFPFLANLLFENSLKPEAANDMSLDPFSSSKGLFHNVHHLDHHPPINESPLNSLHLGDFTIEGSSKKPFFGISGTCINPLKTCTSGFSGDDNAYTSTTLLPDGEDKLLHDDRKGKRLLTKKDSKIHKNLHIIKRPWTHQEDSLLIHLVNEHKIKKWSQIAKKLDGRIGKQCRERWHNHLKPNIKKKAWSEEEEKILIEAHKEIGNKWTEIANRLPGRTENTIKNHWNATKRRQLSRQKSGKDLNSRSTVLQTYINTVISSSSNQNKTSSNTNFNPQNQKACSDSFLTGLKIPSYDHSNEASNHTNVFNDSYDFMPLLNDMPCGSRFDESNMESDMLLDLDNWINDEVKKDMDLVEIISQRSH